MAILDIESRADATTVVPPRYLSPLASNHTGPVLQLWESGALYVSIEMGVPKTRLSMLLDTLSRDILLPSRMMSTYQSTFLHLTRQGTWYDLISLGTLPLEHEIKFGAEEAVLGLSLEHAQGPSPFEAMVEEAQLDIPAFCITIHRSPETRKTRGHLALGALQSNQRDALIRYNQIPPDFTGWGVRVHELRVENDIFHVPTSTAIFDLTTPFTLLPSALFKQLMDRLSLPYSSEEGVLQSHTIACSYLATLPPLHFGIETDEYLWTADRYSLVVEGDVCMVALAGYDAQLNNQPVWVLGSTWLLDRSVVFDKSTRHIGISDYEPDPQLEALAKAAQVVEQAADSLGSQEL